MHWVREFIARTRLAAKLKWRCRSMLLRGSLIRMQLYLCLVAERMISCWRMVTIPEQKLEKRSKSMWHICQSVRSRFGEPYKKEHAINPKNECALRIRKRAGKYPLSLSFHNCKESTSASSRVRSVLRLRVMVIAFGSVDSYSTQPEIVCKENNSCASRKEFATPWNAFMICG